ncbi:MAG: DNA-binding response regulator [Chitinophagia bacterium]|nr:DNA-binding response regulator [Chitinophagia bacterium]
MCHMEKKHQVVVLEDDRILAEVIRERVNRIEDFECRHIFESPPQFLSSGVYAEIVLLDVVMPGMNGLDAIEPILASNPDTAIVMNTIRDDSETIFAALKRGALGYLDKQSFDVRLEEVLSIVSSGGAYMTPKIARNVIDSFHQSHQDFEKLTQRERDVTHAILDGLSYKMIADKLDISVDVVRANIKAIYRKLNINSKGELFRLAKSRH